jgi:hypothetical protein
VSIIKGSSRLTLSAFYAAIAAMKNVPVRTEKWEPVESPLPPIEVAKPDEAAERGVPYYRRFERKRRAR